MNNVNPIYLTEDGLWYTAKRAITAPVRGVRNLFRRDYANDRERNQSAGLNINIEILAKKAASTSNPILRQHYMQLIQQMQGQQEIVNRKSRYGVDRSAGGAASGVVGLGGKMKSGFNRFINWF